MLRSNIDHDVIAGIGAAASHRNQCSAQSERSVASDSAKEEHAYINTYAYIHIYNIYIYIYVFICLCVCVSLCVYVSVGSIHNQ